MKEKIDERIKNIPDKIYLQVGDNIGWEVDFKELEDTGEVTWCSDKIENWDIEYIRASELERLVNQEAEKMIAERITDLDIYDILRRDIELSLHDNYKGVYIDGLEKAATAVYSRLMSQKTEGGGE